MCRWLCAMAVALASVPAQAQTLVVYSRTDSAPAARVQRLAQLAGPVLRDTDLPPGVPWRPVLELLICRADRVLLVWSRRAAASTEVARELQTARLCGVPVVPVLLDSTPLPADVGQIHAVDWR